MNCFILYCWEYQLEVSTKHGKEETCPLAVPFSSWTLGNMGIIFGSLNAVGFCKSWMWVIYPSWLPLLSTLLAKLVLKWPFTVLRIHAIIHTVAIQYLSQTCHNTGREYCCSWSMNYVQGWIVKAKFWIIYALKWHDFNLQVNQSLSEED